MCACSKLTELGDVNFYSWSTSEVAQRALRESNKDSNGERENDALTMALQTKEGFLEHNSMYRKWKTISTLQIDVEELKRQLKTEVLGVLRPILEAQGIQFSDIDGVMSDKERRSSFASTPGGG
jgi:hypothetical protein